MELVIVTGASSGIGGALARHAADAGAVVASISRRPGPGSRLALDLADPGSWPEAADWIRELVGSKPWSRVVMVHAAATIAPIGPVGVVDGDAYTSNVLLNSAAPQVLGDAFVRAVSAAGVDAILIQLTSGAARTPYPGWSSYGAGKAAVDQWVRTVGLEQQERGGRVKVISVGPGVVATDMQALIRQTEAETFPRVERFRRLHDEGELADPDDVAARLWDLLDREDLDNGAVVDLRSLG